MTSVVEYGRHWFRNVTYSRQAPSFQRRGRTASNLHGRLEQVQLKRRYSTYLPDCRVSQDANVRSEILE